MVLQEEGDSRAWIGPYIYDQEGKLIWSGAPLFKGFNVKDFRVNNVNGQDMMTGMYAHKGEAVVVNNKYELQHQVKIGEGRSILNIHDFNTVYNGTRALAMTQRSGYASRKESEAIGYNGGRCHLLFPGFEEFDTSNWQRTFTWSAQNHILMNESFTNHNCKHKWDYL